MTCDTWQSRLVRPGVLFLFACGQRPVSSAPRIALPASLPLDGALPRLVLMISPPPPPLARSRSMQMLIEEDEQGEAGSQGNCGASDAQDSVGDDEQQVLVAASEAQAQGAKRTLARQGSDTSSKTARKKPRYRGGRGQGKAKASGRGGGGAHGRKVGENDQEFCPICDVAHPKKKNSPYCDDHKAVVDAIFRQCKKQNVAAHKKLVEMSRHDKSQWRSLVLRFEQDRCATIHDFYRVDFATCVAKSI